MVNSKRRVVVTDEQVERLYNHLWVGNQDDDGISSLVNSQSLVGSAFVVAADYARDTFFERSQII